MSSAIVFNHISCKIVKAMSTFLGDVATSLLCQYGSEIANCEVVVVSRRAKIYLEKEFTEQGVQPPKISTIDKWILSQHPIKDVKYLSRIELISTLYSVYAKHHTVANLVEFYSFGSMLLGDFDTIDRYMVDAKSLYRLISDTKELESTMNEGDDTIRAALEFWRAFDRSGTERHSEMEFQRVWRSLYEIYVEFNQLLDSTGSTYAGKAYRLIAQKSIEGKENCCGRKLIFVGLNALSSSEREILRIAHRASSAEFIWDYDKDWLAQEAGLFIAKNLKEFPQSDYFVSSSEVTPPPSIEIITSPSEAFQAKITTELLVESPETRQSTAIVLTDENMLLPLLHSLPPELGEINISMGYPLSVSTAGRFLELLIELHAHYKPSKGYMSATVENLLLHPYANSEAITKHIALEQNLYYDAEELTSVDPALINLWSYQSNVLLYLKGIFEALDVGENAVEKAFIAESLGAITDTLSQLNDIEHEVGEVLTIKLLRIAISERRVDFEGHSGQGVQVMGILESRSLDFDRVIMLSLTDDNFPNSRPENSYIPALLLTAYGLPTAAQRSAIWSYYFYRLLNRSCTVSLLYCNIADGLTTGEPSRYILQMRYGNKYTLTNRRVVLPSVTSETKQQKIVEKTPEHIALLRKHTYSPSSLSTYLECSLRFYFRYVEKLKSAPQRVTTEITAQETGNILHRCLELIYKTESDRNTTQVIKDAINEHIDNEELKDSQQCKILRAVVGKMVGDVLNFDKGIKQISKCHKCEETYRYTCGAYSLQSKIDRVDRNIDGSYRVVDYKTGTPETKVSSIEEVFDPTSTKKHTEVMQILIYSYLCHKQLNGEVTPYIYAVRKMDSDDFDGLITIDGNKTYKLSSKQLDDIELSVVSLLDEICNVDIAFSQTSELDSCKYCDYKTICGR